MTWTLLLHHVLQYVNDVVSTALAKVTAATGTQKSEAS